MMSMKSMCYLQSLETRNLEHPAPRNGRAQNGEEFGGREEKTTNKLNGRPPDLSVLSKFGSNGAFHNFDSTTFIGFHPSAVCYGDTRSVANCDSRANRSGSSLELNWWS